MTVNYAEVICEESSPLEPQPTGVVPRLNEIPRIQAVLFDVYGTMLISASGDVGTVGGSSLDDAWRHAAMKLGIRFTVEASEIIEVLQTTIRAHHQKLSDAGIDFPEVDIVEVWRDVFSVLADSLSMPKTTTRVDFQHLAILYECRANAVWPMPGLLKCLDALRQGKRELGIISNAQFFTIELFPALLGRTLRQLGFDDELNYFSYRYNRAKPGTFLFDQARRALAVKGIASQNVLYVGNDMLNDMAPAQQTGFRTALFAGDQRSYRAREVDDRVDGVVPDLKITHLEQLLDCIE